MAVYVNNIEYYKSDIECIGSRENYYRPKEVKWLAMEYDWSYSNGIFPFVLQKYCFSENLTICITI